MAVFVSLAVAAFTSCVKDELHDTSHPDKAKLTVTADWSRRGPSIAVPASWSMVMGDYSETETGGTHAPDYLFTPGDYRLITWNPAENITVEGTTATAATSADGFVNPSLGWLFTSVQDVTLEADRMYDITAVMEQQVRQLTLTIFPSGATVDRITSMECTLTGVAGSMDFATNTYGNESTVPLHFRQITEGEDAGGWTVTVYLLGMMGGRQYLSGYVTFADNNPQPMFIESDMTEIFSDPYGHFNDDKADPVLLFSEDMMETPTGAGMSATITDWETAGREDIEIN